MHIIGLNVYNTCTGMLMLYYIIQRQCRPTIVINRRYNSGRLKAEQQHKTIYKRENSNNSNNKSNREKKKYRCRGLSIIVIIKIFIISAVFVFGQRRLSILFYFLYFAFCFCILFFSCVILSRARFERNQLMI